MFSSECRGQVEPLPALLALSVFAIGLSLYGGVLDGIAIGTESEIREATVNEVQATLSEGSVIVPERLESRSGDLPEDVSISLRSDGRTWTYGLSLDDPDNSRLRHVLVRTDEGEKPGILRVER